MLETKYIITENKMPILFTEGQLHSDFKHFNPISAGFVKITAHMNEPGAFISAEVYGGSDSLNLQSKPEDSKLINSFFFNNY